MQPVPTRQSSVEIDLSPIGIIAGEGNFPRLLARAAREHNIHVSAIGIRGITSSDLADEVDQMHWVDFGKFNRIIEVCHEAGIRKAVMAGRIKHSCIFHLSKIDRRGIKLLARTANRKADTILKAVTDEFGREGIEVMDSTLLLREWMPPSGLLTPQAPPDRHIMEDIEFGRPIADRVAGLDIGQTVVVKEGTVVAVEAMEGTDKVILRAGEQAGAGCVVIKVAKPRQDRRFDVPVIGLTTVKKMIQARCSAMAFPGGQVLFFEQDDACALAASRGISLYAW